MINYSWNTTQPFIPLSFPLTSSASKNIFSFSFDALSIQSYTQILFTHTHTHKIKRAAFCVQVSALSWGMQQLPSESSMMMLESHGTLLHSRSAIIIQPAAVHLPSSWLCVTACLCLSSYTSHCIWSCWLSHILHFVSAALEAACS